MHPLLSRAPLPVSFYERDTISVARELLGAILVRSIPERGLLCAGRIVETEAYLGERDLACHSARGRTARTEVMYGPAGRAYVYLIYGMHCCFNVVTREAGCPEAVLIRALEPLEGCQGRTDGPGRLCRALEIDRALNGVPLDSAQLFIAPGEAKRVRILRAPRIGVDYAGRWAGRLLRFFEAENGHVSRAPRAIAALPAASSTAAVSRRSRR